FRYRLVGTHIVDALGDDFTGRWLHNAHPDFGPGSRTYSDYLAVSEEKQPSWRRGKPVFMAYLDACVELERLILALARDGATVDMLMAISVLFGGDGRER